MFICRRCLLRAKAPKLLPTRVFVRHLSEKKSNSSQNVLHRPAETLHIAPLPHFPSNEPSTDATPREPDTKQVVGHVPTADGLQPKAWYIHVTDEEKKARKEKYRSWKFRPITSYMAQFRNNPNDLVDMPFYAFRWVIKDAVLQGRSDVLNYVTLDVVKRYVGRSHWERLWVLGKLLKSTRQGNTTLPKSKLLLIVETLHKEGYLSIMTPHVLGFTAKAILRYPEFAHLDRKLIKILTPYLLQEADKLKSSIVIPSTQTTVRHLIWPLFGFVQKLLVLDEKDEALALFQKLVDKKFITERSMQGIDLSHKDFTYIMVGTMVQACIHNGWHLQARNLLRQVLDSDESVDPLLIRRVHELLLWSLERRYDSDFEYATSVISNLLSKSHEPMLPDDILNLYYKVAKIKNAGDDAETIYNLTTSPQVLEKHVYAPPSGPGLLWFLEHAIFTSKNFGVARSLSDRILNDNLPVPVHDKGLVVAAIASVGWASHAREMWDRFTHQRDARYVYGNAQTMLRIVSLFNSLIARGERRLEKLRKEAEETKGTPAASNSADAQESYKAALAERDVDEAEDEEELTDLSEDLSELEASDSEVPLAPKRHSGAQSSPDESVPYDMTIERWEARLEDFRAFSEHVVDKFASLRHPLKQANHYDLNALARAYFIMGRYADGFRMYRLILARKEIPDITDVNVALSAMAEHNPTEAANMIERMVAYGLQPDAVSFGTIIHCAIVERDMPLVVKLITRARELGINQLTYKTMGSLVKATVSALYEEEDAPEEQMDKARDLVDSLLSAGFTPSVRMGLDCVVAALRADDPIMAFRFWKLFLKNKSRWDDRQQSYARSRIANTLRAHRTNRWLSVEFANIMISELGEDPSLHADTRRKGGRKSKKVSSNLDPGSATTE